MLLLLHCMLLESVFSTDFFFISGSRIIYINNGNKIQESYAWQRCRGKGTNIWKKSQKCYQAEKSENVSNYGRNRRTQLSINYFIQIWERKRKKGICCEKHNYPVKIIQNWTVVDKEDFGYGFIPFSWIEMDQLLQWSFTLFGLL